VNAPGEPGFFQHGIQKVRLAAVNHPQKIALTQFLYRRQGALQGLTWLEHADIKSMFHTKKIKPCRLY
jgi:hypothetical protein